MILEHSIYTIHLDTVLIRYLDRISTASKRRLCHAGGTRVVVSALSDQHLLMRLSPLQHWQVRV